MGPSRLLLAETGRSARFHRVSFGRWNIQTPSSCEPRGMLVEVGWVERSCREGASGRPGGLFPATVVAAASVRGPVPGHPAAGDGDPPGPRRAWTRRRGPERPGWMPRRALTHHRTPCSGDRTAAGERSPWPDEASSSLKVRGP